jgi:fatty acid desaturase
MGPEQKSPWLAWAAIVVPAFATALTWPLTAGWPLLNRVAVAVAVGLAIYAAVYLAAKGVDRDGS